MKNFIFSAWIILTILAIPTRLIAQITITSSDVLKPVGYTFAEESTGDGSFFVDLGSTGGPQTWDFRPYSTPDQTNMVVVDKSSTPFASDFPTSNMTISVMDEVSSDESYQYVRVDPDLWSFQGIGVTLAESSIVQIFNPQYEIPLPVGMGSSWFQEAGWADTTSGTIMSWATRGHATVDAYGTMTIPMGSFPALRVLLYDTTITTFDFPEPIPDLFDTTTSITYLWHGTDPNLLVQVQSIEGETNPDFTVASDIDRATSPTRIGDNGTDVMIPHTFQLEQNVPNPFNPQTSISFKVPSGSNENVELSVFTIRGLKVRTLLSGTKPPGEWTISWDGRNDEGEVLPSGVYLYRLTSGEKSQTRKMVLAK